MSDPGYVWVPAMRFGVKVVTLLAARDRRKHRSVVAASRIQPRTGMSVSRERSLHH